MLLKQFSNAESNNYLKIIPKTLPEALEKGTPLSVIKRNSESKKLLEVSLLRLFKDLSEMYNVNWPGSVIVLTIDTILEDYYYLRFEEIARVLKKGITGEFNPMMKNLQPSHILDWIGQYDETERLNHFVNENLQYKESYDKVFDEMERKETQDRTKALKDEINRQETYSKAKEVVAERKSKKDGN